MVHTYQWVAWSLMLGGWFGGGRFDAEKLPAIGPRMQQFVDDQQIAGAVTVVGTRDGFVAVSAVGQRDREAGQAMTDNTLFRIASMTKPITAIAIMRCVETGRLAVDDPVEKHLPAFRGQQLIAARSDVETVLRAPARPITIRDLLTHTSGLPGGYPPGLADLYETRKLSLAEAALVASQRPLEFAPGSRWSYCNAGIDTLGRIVEVVSGQSFESYLHEQIFAPLGMVDTTFYPTDEQMRRVAAVYDHSDGRLVRATKLVIGPTAGARHPIPAGGLYSTGPDLARLYRAMLQAGQENGYRLLAPESVSVMTRVQTGDLTCGFVPGMGFGFGWAVVQEPQGVTALLSRGTYGHGGAFGTQGWIDPQRGMFVILLIQRVGLKNADASDMRRELQRLAVEAWRE